MCPRIKPGKLITSLELIRGKMVRRREERGEEERREEEEKTYSWFEGNELEDHLHSENPGEDHVEDVHGIIKQMRLAVMLKPDG